jgi:hypothetical protein
VSGAVLGAIAGGVQQYFTAKGEAEAKRNMSQNKFIGGTTYTKSTFVCFRSAL